MPATANAKSAAFNLLQQLAVEHGVQLPSLSGRPHSLRRLGSLRRVTLGERGMYLGLQQGSVE